ncbi:hypothetical protein [Photobacterium sp. 53610]|uniref:hypothetical protein n=1 Tax=Photobacterium sp. 53610 TaxID=3102789 RepID=UPI002EDB254B
MNQVMTVESYLEFDTCFHLEYSPQVTSFIAQPEGFFYRFDLIVNAALGVVMPALLKLLVVSSQSSRKVASHIKRSKIEKKSELR